MEKWVLEKRLKHREQQRKWHKENPEYNNENRRSYSGYFLNTYQKLKERCTSPSHKKYYGLPFMDKKSWKLFLEQTSTIRRRLHLQWKTSGYLRKLSPSIDKIVKSEGYMPGNCQWVTQQENSRIGGMRRIKP